MSTNFKKLLYLNLLVPSTRFIALDVEINNVSKLQSSTPNIIVIGIM